MHVFPVPLMVIEIFVCLHNSLFRQTFVRITLWAVHAKRTCVQHTVLAQISVPPKYYERETNVCPMHTSSVSLARPVFWEI
jgi:hypothetical protein